VGAASKEAITRRGIIAGSLALLGAGAVAPAPPPAPETVKAVYLSYYGVGDRGIRGQVLELLGRTELNAVVIDVKGDRGFIPYETRVPLAIEAGTLGPVRLRDLDDLLARLRAKGIYTVARLVAFKDNVLARYRPDWAVIDVATGSPWLDNEGLAWLDPFEEKAWAYPIAVAREAAGKGFQEIQFDYLRFPADGRVGAARYSKPNTQEARLRAISAFLERAREALAPTGASLAVDLFGYTAFNFDDTGIGQRVEELAPLVDYLCPMAYPSHLGPESRNTPSRTSQGAQRSPPNLPASTALAVATARACILSLVEGREAAVRLASHQVHQPTSLVTPAPFMPRVQPGVQHRSSRQRSPPNARSVPNPNQ